MTKIDASEYEANWLTDGNSPNSSTPEEGGEAEEQDSEGGESDTPNESEKQAKLAVKALENALSSDRGNGETEAKSESTQNSGGPGEVRKDWVPYEGPYGGQGWQNVRTGEVRYTEEPPGEVRDESSGTVPEDIDEGEVFQSGKEYVSREAESEGEKASQDEVGEALHTLSDNGVSGLSYREATMLARVSGDEALANYAENKEREARKQLTESVTIGDEFDGFEAFIVGGAVRDHFLGGDPKDIDLMAVPSEGVTDPIDTLEDRMEFVDTESAFPVFFDSEGREVALPRTEETTGPGFEDFDAHVVDPSKPVSEQIRIDLERRDMTIGAMAFNARDGDLHDPFNGEEATYERIIEPVGEAFKEDPIRLLRTARFAPRLDMDVSNEIYSMADEMLEGLRQTPDERKLKELRKTARQADNPGRFFTLIEEFDAVDETFPELSGRIDEVADSVNSVGEISDDVEVVMAGLGAGVSDDVDTLIDNHTFSNEEKTAIQTGAELENADSFDAETALTFADRLDSRNGLTPQEFGDVATGLYGPEKGERIEEVVQEAFEVRDQITAEDLMDSENISPEDIGQEIGGEEFGEMLEEMRLAELQSRISKSVNVPLDRSIAKNWIPYRGPQGGEGWQNTENPEDVRYREDPPGEVVEGYEEMAEDWGSEEGSGAELGSFLEEIGHGDLGETMAEGINDVASSVGESPNEVADRFMDRLKERHELTGGLDQATSEQLAGLSESMLESIEEEIEEEQSRDALTEAVESYDELTSAKITLHHIDSAVERVQEETEWGRDELRQDLLNHLENEDVDPEIALDEEGLDEWVDAKIQEAEEGAESPSEVPDGWGKPEEVSFGDWQEFEHGDEQFLENGDRVAGTRNGESFEGQVRGSPSDGVVRIETEDGETKTVETWDIDQYQSQVRDKDEIREELRDHFSNIGQHNQALQEYTGSEHREINGHLREVGEKMEDSPGGVEHAIMATADEDTARVIRNVQAATKQPLPREMNVARGIDVDASRFLDRAEQAMEEDKRLMDEGFQSATIDRDVAEGFGNVTLDIQTDHGVYARAASQHAGEDEVLLPAGTQYEVKDVDRENNTVSVEAHDGFDFNVNVDHIRELIHEEGMSYEEALEYVR